MRPTPESHTRPLAQRRAPWLVAGIVVALVVLAAPLITYAQGSYPPPTDALYVNDYAGVLSGQDAADIQALFSDLRRDTGIEATVLTINSIHDYDNGDASIESFATNLFNTWGIGDKEKNNGALILVAVRDRQMRIELGSGYKDAYNTAMQNIIQEQILPSFKNEQYSQGIYNGAQALVNVLTGPEPSSKQSASLGLVFFVIGVAIVIVGAIVMGLLALQRWSLELHSRHRQLPCPRCQYDMERRRDLTAADCEVWQCLDCGHVTARTSRQRGAAKRHAWGAKARSNDDFFSPSFDNSFSSSFDDSFDGGSSSGGGASGDW